MNDDPQPTITVDVDITNPGQFFACCGLLELADRVWRDAEGWFQDGAFLVTCGGTLDELLAALVANPPKEITRLECNGLEVKPIIAVLEFSFGDGVSRAIVLDTWTKIQSIRGVPTVIANRPWNFWSGQQTSFGIWSALREVLASQLSGMDSDDLRDIFSRRVLQKGRFGFGPGAAWNALDAGFSPNEQGMLVEASAAVELLAAVGLQRFRPLVSDDCESFDYATWTRPLGPVVAAAAMCGALPDEGSVRLRGAVISRGQYAALGESFSIYPGAFND